MSIAQQLITAEQFEKMEFDRPVELVRGEIVECEMPYSQHGAVIFAIALAIGIWNRKHQLGLLATNDSWIATERNPDSVRGPDLFYIRKDKLPGGKFPPGVLRVPADLVVEVLSPSDRWAEALDKTSEYLRSGITEVWIVDPDQRSVDVYQSRKPPRHFDGDDELTRPDLLPGFSCPVAEFFADI